MLEPRFSFNYNFDTEWKTQLRGGVGVSEAVTPGVWLSNPYTNNGLTLFTTGASSGTFNPDPFHQVPPPGTPPAPEVDVTDPNFKLPTVMKASIGFDRELPWWGLVFTVEDQYLNTINGMRYENLNYGAPTGTLPDGRVELLEESVLHVRFDTANAPTPAARRRTAIRSTSTSSI